MKVFIYRPDLRERPFITEGFLLDPIKKKTLKQIRERKKNVTRD